ncbi:hypothetical protein ACWHAM_07670 [Paenibacillus terrae]
MYWFIPLIIFVGLIPVKLLTGTRWKTIIWTTIFSAVLTAVTIYIDFRIETWDTEVWSGKVTDWHHKEEWDEWHPPRKSCSKDSNGKEKCTRHSGYWEHHQAENSIYTTDDGWIRVYRAPDGSTFGDSWPNNTATLKWFWPYGTPSASTHDYLNKVQASYSIFRHKDIDVEQYSDLPEYPKAVLNYIDINRIIGQVPNKAKALRMLASMNTELNKPVPNPEKPGKTKSWKQVNLIFVNVGLNKTQDYGFALQDKWEGGNKNDFVVAFSTNENNELLWVYPFSWSEVELLKIEIRDYMMSVHQLTDFVPIVKKVGNLVAARFVRKSFSDFDYLQIDISLGGWVSICALNLMLVGLYCQNVMEQKRERQLRERGVTG